jgi:hypothetical protein
MSLEQRIAARRSRDRLRDVYRDPIRPVFVRVLSTNENERALNDVFKCCHGRHYFTPCSNCKRTQRDADTWQAYYLAKQ